MVILEAQRILKKYQVKSFALDSISLSINQSSKIAIVGETGSGKSTLLKVLAGLEGINAGKILFKNMRIESPEEKLIPGHKDIAYLSQYFKLPRFQTVIEYLEDLYVLSEEESMVIYQACDIVHLLDSNTDELSGGEKQRIALAKILMSSPSVLLLDEPYSNLDPIHKEAIKKVIDNVSANIDITCVLVAHDPLDVLPWANEIVILQNGKIIQKGKPKELYTKPINEYSAGLFGVYNILNENDWFDGMEVVRDSKMPIIIRPEHFILSGIKSKGKMCSVNTVLYCGAFEQIHFVSDGKIFIAYSEVGKIKVGQDVYVRVLS